MNTRERLYLICISLFMAVYALQLGVFAYLPLEDMRYYLQGLHNNPAAAAAAALLLIAAVAGLAAALRRGAGEETILRQGPLGEVRICFKAVEAMVLKAAKDVKGIRETKTRIVNADSGLIIFIRAVTFPEQSIPQITAEVQSAVKEYVENATGVGVSEVRLMVENVAYDGIKATKAAR